MYPVTERPEQTDKAIDSMLRSILKVNAITYFNHIDDSYLIAFPGGTNYLYSRTEIVAFIDGFALAVMMKEIR